MLSFLIIHRVRIVFAIGLILIAYGYFFTTDFTQGFGLGLAAGASLIIGVSYFSRDKKASA